MPYFAFYNIPTAKTLVQVGQQNLIPAYMVSVSSFSIFWQFLFEWHFIWQSRYGNSQSLPVKSSYIITNRSSCLCTYWIFNRLDVYASGGIVWGLNGSLNLLQIILYFTSIFLPFDPHVYIAACMGLVIVVASSF